jgi:hydrogenase expression/formation protein HypC
MHHPVPFIINNSSFIIIKMCLSIPAKVLSVDGVIAQASVGGAIVQTSLHLVDDVKPGDYVLIHSGFALQKISEQEALETIRIIEELDRLNQEKEA